MFTKRIIPCLDVNKGRVVKGVNFVDLKDAGDPVEIAKAYDAAGADELVFLDITASCEQRETVVDMVRKVAACVFIPFTVGGGIRTVDDFKMLLREGADKISVNSAAIDRPELIREAAEKFGSQCVVAAIDAKRKENRTEAGISTNMADVWIQDWMPLNGPGKLKHSVPVKFSLPAWTVTEQKPDMTLSLHVRSRMQSVFRSLLPAVQERLNIFMMH